MLLSDRDIRAEIDAKRLVLEPWDAELVQPSSVDVRLDRFFRVFNNSQYTHIDPAQQQDELTSLVEPKGEEPFVLHPNEFVLGSTLEIVTLPDDLAGRLEGKALALDTPVPTPSGWRTMADLAPGDAVFDEYGKPCSIVAATPPMLGRPCRRVELSDHSSFVADASHQWITTTKNSRKHHGGALGIRTTDEIADSLRQTGEVNHHIPLAGVAVYPRATLPIDPYVLGYWLGDGTSTKAEVTIGLEDEIFVREQFHTAGYATWKASSERAFRVGGLSRKDVGRLRTTDGRYCADGSLSSELRALGLIGDKHVPVGYLTADADQRLALLQGLMDSDGYCDVYGRCEFDSTRE